MKIDIIEKNCLAILNELKNSQFTREELEFLQIFFQEIVNKTEQKLLSK